jgi:hypothetical protein
MPTIQERYDIERKRMVKNTSLLKDLKAQMNEAYIVEAEKPKSCLNYSAPKLQRIGMNDEYERLTAKLTQIHVVNEVVIAGIVVTAGTDNSAVTHDITAYVPVAVQEVNAVIREVTERNVITAGTDLTDIALYDDDDDIPKGVDRSIPFDRGCTFASPTDLLDLISDFAKAHNFTVRREKHAIVCSNAGQCNWTTVTDYEARASKTFRKLHKHLDQDVDDNLEDIMQIEEDK